MKHGTTGSEQATRGARGVKRASNGVFVGIIGFAILFLFLFFLAAIGHVIWKGLPDLFLSLKHPEIQFAIRLSLFTSVISTLICFLFAVPAAYGLERFSFPGKRWINVILNVPVSLPPLVCGVALLLFFANTKLGEFLGTHGLGFIFSPRGIVLGQFFIITPYMIRVLRSTFADIDTRLEFVARTLGCSHWQAFYKVTLPIARNGIISGIVIGWSRAIGEFGCTLMLAGATRMVTETLPVAVYLNMSVGNLQTAMAAATCLILISVVSLFIFEMAGSKKVAVSRLSGKQRGIR